MPGGSEVLKKETSSPNRLPSWSPSLPSLLRPTESMRRDVSAFMISNGPPADSESVVPARWGQYSEKVRSVGVMGRGSWRRLWTSKRISGSRLARILPALFLRFGCSALGIDKSPSRSTLGNLGFQSYELRRNNGERYRGMEKGIRAVQEDVCLGWNGG